MGVKTTLEEDYMWKRKWWHLKAPSFESGVRRLFVTNRCFVVAAITVGQGDEIGARHGKRNSRNR
jgi:hypothetical protein